VDNSSHSRPRIRQTILSGIHVLSGTNSLKHSCEQIEEITGCRPCDPTGLPETPRTVRVPSDKEGKGSRAGIGGHYRMGTEAIPGHEKIPPRRAPLRAYAHWRRLSSSPGKRHDNEQRGVLVRIGGLTDGSLASRESTLNVRISRRLWISDFQTSPTSIVSNQ